MALLPELDHFFPSELVTVAEFHHSDLNYKLQLVLMPVLGVANIKNRFHQWIVNVHFMVEWCKALKTFF